MWVVLVAVLATAAEEGVTAPPLVQVEEAPGAVEWKPLQPRSREAAVPLLSQSAGGRAARFGLVSVAGGIGSLAGAYGFGMLGAVVGGILGGCGLFTAGGNGCWIGLGIGALLGHPLGLYSGVVGLGRVLGTKVSPLITLAGVAAGELAMLGAFAVYSATRPPGSSSPGNDVIWVLAVPGLVAALVQELGDAYSTPVPVAVAPMPLRGGGGLAVTAAF